MKDFFLNILPDTGIYFIATKNSSGNGFSHYPFTNILEMVSRASELDVLKLDTYFACASFKQKSYVNTEGKIQYRTAENAGWAKSFWLDVDCGADKVSKEKGYIAPDEAYLALQRFTEAVGLPMPLVVLSGGGLHCYWPLAETITKDEWKPVAEKLKMLTRCPEIRLLVDDSRTSDIASVLRPVGTHNWKPERGGKEVALKNDAKQIVFTQFGQLIEAAFTKYCAAKKPQASKTKAAHSLPNDPETPKNIARVNSALAVLNPDCEYPLWRDIIFSLHAFGWSCSEQLARSWSKGDKQNRVASSYDELEFEKLWNSVKAKGGINPGTLFHHAKLNGWSDQHSSQDAKDIRNARLFAEANCGRLLFIAETGNVLTFSPDEGWLRASSGEAISAAKAVVSQMRTDADALFRLSHDSAEAKELIRHAQYSSTSQRIQAMIELSKSEQGMSTRISMFDADENLLGVRNGILNLRTKQLQHITPELLVSKRVNVSFDSSAMCPQWQKFLDDIQPEQEVQRLLRQLSGVFLCGESNLQKLIFLHGQGANGKSTFIELFAWLLGDYCKRIATEMLMQHQRSPQGPSPDIVSLKGRRLIYCNEVEEGRRLAEARVKELTGGDTLSGRVPYAKEDITFQPSHKLVMVGNHMPEIQDMSHGMWRRMLLIPFEQIIPEEKRDPAMLDKLKGEGAGVLNWALAGYHDYLQHGLLIPKSVDGATHAYRNEQDILGEWISDQCTILASAATPKALCYNAYSFWARGRGQIPLAQGRFTRRLADRGYELDAGRRNITGLCLNEMGKAAARITIA